MKKILFQGDSITDCHRTKLPMENMGAGYPLLVQAKLGFENPGKYEFVNRGISGNRIVDIYARIKADIINLAPDYMSLLIGVNDVWHDFDFQNGVSADKYEKLYCMLIEEIREALPNIKLMILEPFCIEGMSTQNTEEAPNKLNEFSSEVRKRAAKAKAVAEKYGIIFIPLQDKFDEAAKVVGNEYWIADGVHPAIAGHELIKREWLKAFETLKNDDETV